MTPIRRGSAKQKHQARHTWLSAHPELFQDVPGINDDVTDAGRLQLDALCQQMRALGLFGAKGGDLQREAIRRIVSELRGEHVDVGW